MAIDGYGDIRQALLELIQYKRAPGKTPQWLIDIVIKFIDPNYKVIGLYDISGESFIFKVLNELKEEICIKIAHPSESFDGQRIVKIYDHANYKIKTNNPTAQRYIEGSKIQKQIYNQIIRENISSFYVPAIHKISTNPLYIEMEWVQSDLILSYLNSKRDLITTLLHFLKLLEAVEYIHEFGIIHRDLKPSNILAWNNFGVVVLDWTMAKQIGNRNLTAHGASIGTTPFASPRMMVDATSASFQDDIHQLGYTFWAFLSRREPPILSGDSAYYENDIIKYRYSLLKNPKYAIEEPFLSIFLKATEPDEEKRYKTVKEMHADVDKLISDLTKTNNPKTVFDLKDIDILEAIGLTKPKPNKNKESPSPNSTEPKDNLATQKTIITPANLSVPLDFIQSLCNKYKCKTPSEEKLMFTLIQIFLDVLNQIERQKYENK